jgi:hypothetical protein
MCFVIKLIMSKFHTTIMTTVKLIDFILFDFISCTGNSGMIGILKRRIDFEKKKKNNNQMQSNNHNLNVSVVNGQK